MARVPERNIPIERPYTKLYIRQNILVHRVTSILSIRRYIACENINELLPDSIQFCVVHQWYSTWCRRTLGVKRRHLKKYAKYLTENVKFKYMYISYIFIFYFIALFIIFIIYFYYFYFIIYYFSSLFYYYVLLYIFCGKQRIIGARFRISHRRSRSKNILF
jgi:hypothetical protein